MATQASVATQAVATQAVATQADDNSGRWQLRPVATQAGGNQGQDIMNIELTLIKNAGLQTEKRRGEIFTDDDSVSENVGKFLNLGKGWRNVGMQE